MLSIFTLKVRKIVVILVTNMFLYGCVAGGTNSTLSSTNRFTSETPSQALSLSLPLEINIVELDPGIPSKASEYEKEGVWPELRRAESRKFSNDLKASLFLKILNLFLLFLLNNLKTFSLISSDY